MTHTIVFFAHVGYATPSDAIADIGRINPRVWAAFDALAVVAPWKESNRWGDADWRCLLADFVPPKPLKIIPGVTTSAATSDIGPAMMTLARWMGVLGVTDGVFDAEQLAGSSKVNDTDTDILGMTRLSDKVTLMPPGIRLRWFHPFPTGGGPQRQNVSLLAQRSAAFADGDHLAPMPYYDGTMRGAKEPTPDDLLAHYAACGIPPSRVFAGFHVCSWTYPGANQARVGPFTLDRYLAERDKWSACAGTWVAADKTAMVRLT